MNDSPSYFSRLRNSHLPPSQIPKRLFKKIVRRYPRIRPLFDCFRFRLSHLGPDSAIKRIRRSKEWIAWDSNSTFHNTTSEERLALLELAEQTCQHNFNLLGSGSKNWGNPIEWNLDVKSGYQWDANGSFNASSWTKLPPGVDVKIPWELSRCHHFVTLGLADLLTGNPKYFQEYKSQTLHWLTANPAGCGVNWMCSMDIAIRAINWITAIQLFNPRFSTKEESNFIKRLDEALWIAGLHIWRNLEWEGEHSDNAGNHFIANLTGLIGVGLYFRDHKKGRIWLDFGKRWLGHEMLRQVNADGTHFETSTYYHRLVMEMFSWSFAVCQKAGLSFDSVFSQRLEAMSKFTAAYTPPSRVAPQIGDNDSGRFLTSGVTSQSDHTYLNTPTPGFGGILDRNLLGAQKYSITPQNPPWLSVFPQGGYIFGSNRTFWFGLRAGPVTRGGSHAHCDQLALILSVDSEDILIDRGTGCYSPDPELRNFFRSTQQHNTLRLNEWEQNEFEGTQYGLFAMNDDTHTKILQTTTYPDGIEISASHQGYSRFRQKFNVMRSISLKDNSCTIRDQMPERHPTDSIQWNWNLRAGLFPVARDSSRVVVPIKHGRIEVSIPTGCKFEITKSLHSPSYGSTEPAYTIRVSAVSSSELSFDTEFKFTPETKLHSLD